MGFVPENQDPGDRNPHADEDPHPNRPGRSEASEHYGAKAPRSTPPGSGEDSDYDSDAVTDADFEPELIGGEPRLPAIFRDPPVLEDYAGAEAGDPAEVDPDDNDAADEVSGDEDNGLDETDDKADDFDSETGQRFVPPTFGPSRPGSDAEVTHYTGQTASAADSSRLETPQPTGQDRVPNDSGVLKHMATVAVARPGIRSGEPSSAPRLGFVSDWSQFTDADIMLRVRDGDDAGYEYLVTKYRKPILHFMFRMVHNQAIAEELAQEVFLRVYRSRATYRAEARFTTWMYRIATNLGVNYARDTKHERAASNVYLDEPDYDTGTTPDLADSTPLVEADLVREERMKAIRAHVMALPERQRTAVFMHKYQGLDYKQIGQVLKLSESATKSLLFRAYQTLRDRLKDFV